MPKAVDLSPAETAQVAGLRYVDDSKPGIRRLKSGKSFQYVSADGKQVRDRATLERIKKLAIPPAYADVWICPQANGHIQATGRDDRGRKQYRYHERWREVRDGTKYDRMIAFGQALPGLRKTLNSHLKRDGLPREKVLASVVKLLETTHVRIGNDEYAKQNRSYGLTTIHNRHVAVKGTTMRFSFNGKSGIRHAVKLTDRRIAKIVRGCQDLPGQELFAYADDDGATHDVGSADVNDYIREITGQDFTAKDFRTWAGTVQAAVALASCAAGVSATEAKKNVVAAVKEVSGCLRNTPAVCRKCYVHPAVIEAYLDGSLPKITTNGRASGLKPAEKGVLRFLKAAKKAKASGKA